MTTAICGNWHVWESGSKGLISDEKTKTLKEVATIDEVVNLIYIAGDKVAARSLHLLRKNFTTGKRQ